MESAEILQYRIPNLPLAVIETRTNKHAISTRFPPFGTAMANLTVRTTESASYVHLRLYKAITRQEDHQKA